MLTIICFFLLCPGMPQHESFDMNDEQATGDPCIEKILAEDAKLAEMRNTSSEIMSLAVSILNYVEGLEALDFNACPEGFQKAFKAHIGAWRDLVPTVQDYEDWRGEMHLLFDRIKSSKGGKAFKKKVDKVGKTWEAVMKES